jgi:acyl-ACP thioesterase
MTQPIWTRRYEINTYLVNSSGNLGLFGLLNLIQDTAWVHATHLGHGYEAMVKSGLIWVLTRQKLIMDRWPKWGESIEVKTWVRPLDGLFANRDFEFFVGAEKVGECTTSWLTLDLRTRKPRRVDAKQFPFECRTDFSLSFDAPKIDLRNDLIRVAEFRVRGSDLDLNEHVNNTRYAQWILDSISMGAKSQFLLREYGVNFLAETQLEDEISIEMGSLEPIQTGEDWVQFQGRKKLDLTPVFVSKLRVIRTPFFSG